MPAPMMDVPPFRVVYTCGQQLCLAEASGEVQHLTDLPPSNQVTDFVVDPLLLSVVVCWLNVDLQVVLEPRLVLIPKRAGRQCFS